PERVIESVITEPTIIAEPIINPIEIPELVIEPVIVEPTIIAEPIINPIEIPEPVIEPVIVEPAIAPVKIPESAISEIELSQTPETISLENTLDVAELGAMGVIAYSLTDFTPTENADVPPIAEFFTGEISTQKPTIPSVEISEPVIEESAIAPVIEEPETNIVTQTVIEESAIAPVIEEPETNIVTQTVIEESALNPVIEEPETNIIAQTVIEESAIAPIIEEPETITVIEESAIAPVIEEPATNIVTQTVIEESSISKNEIFSDVTTEPETLSSENTLGLGVAGLVTIGAISALTDDTSPTEEAIAPATEKITEPEITSESLATVDEVLPELPTSYGESRIYLMPRDPHSAYAYWDVLETDKINLQEQGGYLLALRLYDVTNIDLNQQAPHSMQQYECDEMAKEWFFGVPMSDRDYIVEIGYINDHGGWLMLARSLPTHIPPLYPSEVTSDQFVTINWFDQLEDKTWQIPQELLLQPGLPIVQGSYYTLNNTLNKHHTASGMGMSGVGLTASGVGMSGVGLTVSGMGMSGVGLTASGIGYTTSGMGYTTSGVGMSGIGMIYTTSGVGYSASGIGYTTSGMGLTTSG
ncbi:MAG: DUF4912 domain-containing protein, partial [Microcoleaceae cyanobacterium]